jgi:hypothetical protein
MATQSSGTATPMPERTVHNGLQVHVGPAVGNRRSQVRTGAAIVQAGH